MFVQTEITPNPNSIKFLPGKPVSNSGSFEVNKKDNRSIVSHLVYNDRNQPGPTHSCIEIIFA